MVEHDTHIGRIMDQVRELGLDKNTLVFYTVDNGAWRDVFPTLAPQQSYRADHRSRSREPELRRSVRARKTFPRMRLEAVLNKSSYLIGFSEGLRIAPIIPDQYDRVSFR